MDANVSINVNNGIVSASHSVTGGYFMPYYGGHKDNLYPKTLAGDRDWPGLGFNHRIDANKYRVLSYRLNHTSRSNFAIYWHNDTNDNTYLGDLAANFVSSNDGLFNNSQFRSHSGFVVYNYDMTNLSQFGQSGGSWSGNVFALRLDPSTGAPPPISPPPISAPSATWRSTT